MKKLLTLTISAVMLAFGANGAWAQAAGPFPNQMTDGATGGPVGSVTPSSISYGGSEYEVYTVLNTLLVGTTAEQNATKASLGGIGNAAYDSLEVQGQTSTWESTGTGGGYSVIGVAAGATNTLEVYDASTPGNTINPLGLGFTGTPGGPVGAGTSSSPYLGTTSSFPVGTQFGFAINSLNITSTIYSTPANGYTWYSNPALNSDGMDHMLVYNLSALNGTVVYITDPITGITTTETLENADLLAFEDLPMGGQATGNISDMDFNDLDVIVNGAAPVPEPITVALFGIGLLAMAGFSLRRKLSFLSNLTFAG